MVDLQREKIAVKHTSKRPAHKQPNVKQLISSSSKIKKKIICGRHNNQTAPDELYKIMEEINSKMIALFSASQLLWCSKNWL